GAGRACAGGADETAEAIGLLRARRTHLPVSAGTVAERGRLGRIHAAELVTHPGRGAFGALVHALGVGLAVLTGPVDAGLAEIRFAVLVLLAGGILGLLAAPDETEQGGREDDGRELQSGSQGSHGAGCLHGVRHRSKGTS